MVRKLEGGSEGTLGYHVSGRVTRAEILEMQRELEAAIERTGSVRILLRIGQVSGAEAGAVWQDLKFAPHYLRDVERFAIVGEESWRRWIARVTDLLARGEARFFPDERLEQAWEWIGEGAPA
jgi:hypothetical protein